MEEEDLQCVLGVLESERGRQFLWRILSHCKVYEDINGEGAAVFRMLGARKVGLDLLGILTEANDSLVIKMMQESKDRSELDEQRTRQRIDTAKQRRDNYDDVGLDPAKYAGQHESGGFDSLFADAGLFSGVDSSQSVQI